MSAARDAFALWKSTAPDEDEPDVLGIEVEGADAAALTAFENKHGITLPAAFRELWLLSDGTSTMDRGEHIFWPLDVIDSELARWNESGKPGWIPFADFRLSARTFMLRYEGESEPAVWVFDALDRWPAGATRDADTFDAFLTRYVERGR